MKIKIKDINGNWVWYDTETKLTTSAEVLLGTIRNNVVKSVGADTSTKKGRVMAAYNQTQSYNRRLHKVHNYADQTTRLKLKQLTVSVDNTGEPIINQTDYNPGVEAPMKPYTPLEEFYVGAKVLDLPFKFGSKAVQYGLGRYGSRFGWNEVLLSARNKILGDVFDRQSLKLITPLTTTLLYLTLKFTPITPNDEGALTFFLRKPSKISVAERMGVPKGLRNLPFKEKQLTEHVQGDEAVKMFKEYGGESIPEGSINGELLRKYVAEARERYGLTNNKNITDEEIAQALYKHSKELGGNTAAVNAQGEPLLLFRGDTKAYTELRNNHHESGGTEDNVLGTLFLDRTGIGEGWGPDRYLYLANKNGLVMAPYRTGIESESFSLLKPKFKDDYLYDGFGKGYISDEQISYPYWNYARRSGETIQGNKIASDNFADGTVNHLNAFVVRTPSVRDITNEVVVTGGKPGTPPPFNWLIPKESRIGHDLHDVRLALNKAVVEEAKKYNQGLLKSDRGSYWRGEEHEDYDYFALPDFNVQGAKHLLPYDLRIPRNWKDKNIYRGLIPLTAGYTLYNSFNQPQLQYLKQGGKINMLQFLKNGGIHIKKKNKGKFTDYCNGKVTLECINRGKHSSNPITRKRAIFADNARHFKHKLGSKLNKFQQGGSFDLVDYIKAIENPNKVGWNGKVWVAPPEGKGYDPNLRGYGIDVEYNVAAKKLTEGRPGRYITDLENDSLMRQHLDYIRDVATRRILGFNKLSPIRLGVILGMLYRGDSVKDINIKEPNDYKFFDLVHDYYRKVGVGERAKLSSEYLANLKKIHAPKIISTLNSDNISTIKPTYIPVENKKARYPTNKKGSYIKTMTRGENFIENLKEKIRIQNLMNNLKPTVKESYKFPISFNKKGGIVKASTGASLFGKIGNFLNSDTGKSVINGITSIGSAIKSNKLLGDSAELAKSGIDFETKLKKAQAHNYGYNRALDYIRSIQDPNNPNAFGGDIFLNHFANLMANQFTLGFDEEAEAKKLLIDLQMKLLQVDTMSGAINSFADSSMSMLLNLLNNKKSNSIMNNINQSNLSYINNYKSITTPLMKSIKDLSNFLIKY